MNDRTMPHKLPKMIEFERSVPPSPAWDFRKVLSEQFAEQKILDRIKPSGRIAVAVGSRGIANLSEIVSCVVSILLDAGMKPFIVPAMGSHGGATPAGQSHILAEYGITEKSTGVPVDARMETRLIGTAENDVQVFFSEAALEADGIILINRIKPHTDFSGSLGSGILKMIAIGLGKHRGAMTVHAAASRLGHEQVIRSVARLTLENVPILCGVAVVEDQNHRTAELRVIRRQTIESEEHELFTKSLSLIPKLPVDEVDLLIVDFMGKNLSGTGMDTNVIARSVYGYSSTLFREPVSTPKIYRIFVRDLTDATNGNAVGIGLADFTTTRLVDKIDRMTSYTNALTALSPSTVKIPIYFDTDRECIENALASLALPETVAPRILRISNTLSLNRFQASDAYIDELSTRADLAVKCAPRQMEFDSVGNLLPWGVEIL
jgi:Lactate racemase N-terminal domain